MAFHNPVTVELFNKDDKIIMPVTAPISTTLSLSAHDFNYIAVQVETFDRTMREVLSRWADKELIQYRVSGRFGTDTGDVSSIYAYDTGSGEFTFYGRSHKEILQQVLGFPDPQNNNPRSQWFDRKAYEGSALKVVRDVLNDNLVGRLGVPIDIQSGDVGNNIKTTFRFDSIHRHLYEDTKDKGGTLLATEGNIIFDITRDFAQRRFVLRAREPEHHPQMIEVRSGLIDRWQFTAERSQVDRAIVGGPGESVDRHFAERSRDEVAHRHFPAEGFFENTVPEIEGDVPEGEDPTDQQILDALLLYAEGKLDEYAEKSAIIGELTESDHFYLGDKLQLGDWVRIGVDSDLDLGEQQIEKAIITWTREAGYSVQLTKPEGSDTAEEAVLKRVVSAMRELSTRTRRR